MLHRSFKSSKCKTASKLAMSRIKLLKNKNEEQLKKMKRDLAQLLESGKIQTARIRVEHVIREEKMMAAYDLIGIYCELISTRMTIIESQKNCPIDMKEAITSVIFAARRCADIPELNDIQKHFKTKYGKEFSTAAVELRPECGVGRLLVEKLSAVAPDGQTKVRVLGAIAKEHNIKWDPETFGEEESKPPNDLLSRPNSFEKGSQMHAEPSYFQPSPSHDQMHTEPLNFSNQNPKSSLRIQNLPSSGSTTARFTTFDPEVRPFGMQAKVGQSCPMQGNVFPSGTKDWNLEFKDATSAAQAAAESAELASMAARAAAELSRQYSLESQKSNIEVSRDEGPANYAASSFAEESLSKYSANNSFLRRHSKFQAELIDGSKHENLDGSAQTFHQSVHCRTGRFNQSASLKLNRSLIEEDSNSHGATHIQKSWPEKETTKKVGKSSSYQMSEGKQSPEFDVTYDGEMNYSTEERYKKQPSTIPFDSYSSTKYMENKGISGDDYKVSNFNHLRYGNVTGKNPSVVQSTRQNDTIRGSSKNDGAVFDEYSSDDDDDNRFAIRPSMQNPVNFSQDSFMHVTFDRSDSTDSENASEMKRFLIRKKDSRTREQIASSYEESCPLKECSINRQRTELEVHSPMKNDLGKSPLHEPDGSSGTFDEFQRQSSSRSGKELNFRLTGGLRNKGSSPKNLSQGNSNMIMRSPPHSASVKDPVSFRVNLNRNNKVSSRAQLSQSDSDVDNSEEVLQGTSSEREEPCAQKAKKGVNIKSNLRYPTALNSSGDDSDEDLTKQFFHNSMGSGISQSTDTRSSNSEASSYSKLRRGTKGLINSDTRGEMKSNRSYCDTRTPTMLQSRSAISDSRRNYEHSKFAPSNSMPSYKTSVREGSSIAQSSSPLQKTVRLGSSKDEKTSASTGESPSTENFDRKASHVHPKLPDYDTLAAHMQSLRSKS